MSFEAREWVWEHSASKGTARLVLSLIADRVVDQRCVAYASVPTLMRRANASRTAVRDALAWLRESGELVQLKDRKGPRGETFFHLPLAAEALAERPGAAQQTAPGPDDSSARETTPTQASRTAPPPTGGTGIRPGGPESAGPVSDPGEWIPTPGGTGIRPDGGPDSDPQNSSEPKVNGKSSSSALIPAADWHIDETTRTWLQRDGHTARLGDEGLHAADAKWRSYRAGTAPRTADAWAADWRAWIARERTPGRPHLYALPGPRPAPAGGRTRAEAHTAALLAALDEPTGTE